MKSHSCLHVLAILNNAAINIRVSVSFSISVVFCFFFETYPGVGYNKEELGMRLTQFMQLNYVNLCFCRSFSKTCC